MSRRRPAALVLAAALIGLSSTGGPAPVAHADHDPAPPPAQWPDTPLVSARVEGAAHAVRFSGPDRYQTSLALALGLRGTGDYPFDSPDRTSNGAPSLAAASGWWGAGACPRAIIVVAGDVAADALAASALSDPTDLSREPYLRRTAAADPLFDPIGGFTRVDTDSAPIIVTRSARDGATSLSPPARSAARDLRSGGCITARQAIVVGGPAAVPSEVDDELISIGYDEVFRVQGSTRYATAAAVAQSLGTDAAPEGLDSCIDPVVNDGAARMTFVANSVVEYRPSPESCELLSRTVVLADGLTGADALAAGWWTSFWQVPVVLHDGSDRLPLSTAAALATLGVDHVIVLGGELRIPDAVVDEAVALTGGAAIRVAGANRYETSVEMARLFGGWWPTGRGAEYAGSMVCLAASSGDAGNAQGWPDALSAGPWCGAANGAAANPGAPDRALTPTTGATPVTAYGAGAPARPGHDAVPILLVPFGATSLPPSVRDLLADSFDSSDDWCSSTNAGNGTECPAPGFAIAFGGPTAISDDVVAQASRLVSGNPGAESAMQPALVNGAFHTTLDLAPVFGVDGVGSGRVCVNRGTYQRARWLAVFDTVDAARTLASTDLMLQARYRADADGVVRSAGSGAPSCVAYSPGARDEVFTRAVGLAGRVSEVARLLVGDVSRTVVLGDLTAATPTVASGVASDTDESAGGTTFRSYTIAAADPPVAISSGGQPSTVSAATLTITLVRGTDTATTTGPDLFTATWSISTPAGDLEGVAEGEAILVDGTWELRGASTVTASTWNAAPGAVGGFAASLATNTPGDGGDDSVAWRVDAFTPA